LVAALDGEGDRVVEHVDLALLRDTG